MSKSEKITQFVIVICIAAIITAVGNVMDGKHLFGDSLVGVPKGDLYVYIFVRPHKEFERNGNDVISRVNISFAQAALGATIQVNTLDGKVELKIPEGTQTGTAFRVKGKGIPYLRNPNQRGDQHIVVTVQTPKKLTDTQRELLLRFANESNEDVNNLQVSKSLFEKIKDCLTK